VKYKKTTRDGNQAQVSWAIFGARMAGGHEAGVVFTDLHRDNLASDRSGDIVIIDYGDVDKVLFPNEWELLPTALLSLLSWLSNDFSAAFRFGYLHYGGPIAKLVFDSLRSDFGVNSLRDFQEFNSAPPPTAKEEYTLKKLDYLAQEWRQRRDGWPLGNISKGSLNLEDLDRWRGNGNGPKLRLNFEADEYHYKKHLLASLAHGSLIHFFEALLNLQALYFTKKELVKAAGLAHYCDQLCVTLTDHVPDQMKEQLQYLEQRSFYPFNVVALVKELPMIENVFHWIWCLDDYARASALSDLTE
jgi:hypothetical protein